MAEQTQAHFARFVNHVDNLKFLTDIIISHLSVLVTPLIPLIIFISVVWSIRSSFLLCTHVYAPYSKPRWLYYGYMYS